MTARCRYLLAAVVGLGMVPHAPAEEPAPLDVASRHDLTPRLPLAPNQQVANTIAENLRQSGHLHGYTIDITFAGGTADLSGSVADQPQREEALRIAQGVPGVERVRDHMIVMSPPEVTQAQASTPAPLEIAPVPRKETALAPTNGGFVEPMPMFQSPSPSAYDLNPPKMPTYAWPTYAPYDNFSRVAYPTLYPYQSWPFIGPVYPFPKIPPGWRKITLEWKDGHWWYGSHASSHDWWVLRYW